MDVSYLCGLLMGIALMNMVNGIRGLVAASRDNDRVSVLLMRIATALGIITLALQVLWLLKLVG